MGRQAGCSSSSSSSKWVPTREQHRQARRGHPLKKERVKWVPTRGKWGAQQQQQQQQQQAPAAAAAAKRQPPTPPAAQTPPAAAAAAAAAVPKGVKRQNGSTKKGGASRKAARAAGQRTPGGKRETDHSAIEVSRIRVTPQHSGRGGLSYVLSCVLSTSFMHHAHCPGAVIKPSSILHGRCCWDA